ncbi:hypothetical protein [Cupriavidus sp. TMH.W2]|uniref:hypothetical protein n=1 Tax=Cupriavidus sp. TMH.W2 TaxID=3434465 RepID=UPI003D783C44
MNANLSPKSVKPAAALRWVKQAFDLIGRGFIAWLVLMLIFCLAIYLCRASLLISQVAAAVAYLSGIGVAALVDDASEKSFVEIFSAARAELGAAVRFTLILTFAATALSAVFYWIGGRPGDWFLRLYDPSLLAPAADGDSFVALNRVFLSSLMALILFQITFLMPFIAATFQYHLQTFFGVGWFQAFRLGNAGVPEKNVGAMLLFNSVIYAVLLFAAALAPIAAPVVFAFLSAYSYVAFREIYLGVGENRKVVLAEVRGNVASAA